MDVVAPPYRLLDGRWQLGEVLGRGAAADVFAAVDTASGDSVAVKVLRFAGGDAVHRFEREVAALEGVDHPGIVAVLGHGELEDGRPFVVLERAGGGTLAEALAAGPLGPSSAAQVGADLARALHHAHHRGVVHRDVKPANVLLDAAGHPKLADFGTAHLLEAGGLTATGWVVGTPAYLAPEQLRGGPIGPPADVYALGLVVLEAATGERAFSGDGVPAALARLEQPVEVPSSLPGGLASAIRAMTAAEPSARPDAGDAAERLDAATDAGATTAVPVASTPTTAIPVASGSVAPRPIAAAASARSRWTAQRLLVVVAVALALAGVLHGLLSTGGEWPPGDLPTTTSTTAVVTTVPAPAPSAPPTTAGEDGGDGAGRGNGNGNGRGNGRGHDDG